MSKKGRLLSNTLILGVGSAISKLTVFCMMPLYTAHLSPAAFGTAEVLINTAALLLPWISLGAPEAIFRFVAGGSREAAVLPIGRKMLIGGFGLLLLLLPLLGLFSVFRPYLLYLLLYVIFAVLHSFAAHVLRGRGQYGLLAIQQLFCTLATVMLAYLFLPVFHWGERGYLMAIFLADALTAAILLCYLRVGGEKESTAAASDESLLRPMLRYALPLIPTATLWWSLAFFDRYLLLAHHGEALTGVYAAAGKLPSLLTLAASVFLEAWHFAAIHESEAGRGALFERIYRALLPALVLCVSVLMLGSRFLVAHLFAADFSGAALYVPLLSIGALFSALSAFLGSVYVVRLRSGASLATALVGAAVNVALCFLWIPSMGALGAVL